MKKLVFKEVSILSKVEKAGRTETFSPTINLLTGENDVGNVLSEADYKNFERQIKTNALGSDLPRSLLAQHFAFLQTMAKFNPAVTCPIVLDSPLQQEQDKDNIAAIFKFIFSHVLDGQQLILGTLSVDDTVVPKDTKMIHLTDELRLLQREQYQSVLDRIGTMHETMLNAE